MLFEIAQSLAPETEAEIQSVACGFQADGVGGLGLLLAGGIDFGLSFVVALLRGIGGFFVFSDAHCVVARALLKAGELSGEAADTCGGIVEGAGGVAELAGEPLER
jgi:hypothetical protein